jgi:hypothetical protein
MTKQGIPAALALTGDPDAAVSVVRLAVAPAALHIGDNAELEIALRPRLEPAANHGARLRASGLKTSTRAGGA